MSEPPTVSDTLTADELLYLQLPGKRTELVRGRLIVSEPPGYQHGLVAFAIAARIGEFVRANRLGVVLAAETGFKLFSKPDTVRAPDAAYISQDRAPDPPPLGYADLAPDLAVEVLSPNDRAGDVQSKVSDWLNAGARLVWVIDPELENVTIYRPGMPAEFRRGTGTLDATPVLPGFSLDLDALFRTVRDD